MNNWPEPLRGDDYCKIRDIVGPLVEIGDLCSEDVHGCTWVVETTLGTVEVRVTRGERPDVTVSITADGTIYYQCSLNDDTELNAQFVFEQNAFLHSYPWAITERLDTSVVDGIMADLVENRRSAAS